MDAQHRPARVAVMLVFGLVCFSLSPILIKLAKEAPPMAVAAWRSIFAVTFLLPFAYRTAVPQLRRLDRQGISLVILAAVFLAGHFIFWIESLYYTSVASAATLVAASPIFIAILGFILLRERLGPASILAILIAVFGSVLVGLGDVRGFAGQVNPLFGNSLALGAALLVSFYLIIGRALRQRLDWLPYIFGMYFAVMLIIVTAALLSNTQLFGLPPYIYLLCALMGLLPQIIGHGSFNYAVKYFDAAFLGLLSLTEPVGGSIIAFFLFEEIPNPVSAIGLIAVLSGLALGILAQKSKTGPRVDH